MTESTIFSSGLLVGNSFPLSLVRRRVTIEPLPAAEIAARLAAAGEIRSFWGHANTLAAVQARFGVDLTPAAARPVLTLNGDNFPQLGGEVFRECLILSPDYRSNFRPQIGVEVSPEEIRDWQGLIIIWE